jgi:hypothetical protein
MVGKLPADHTRKERSSMTKLNSDTAPESGKGTASRCESGVVGFPTAVRHFFIS